MRSGDLGTLAGCSIFIGIIVVKVAIFLAIVYVAWHFITKYW